MPKLPKSDTETMTIFDKGQILQLNKDGRTKKQIAKVTGRSMSWIEDVIAAISGTTAEQELIAKYNKGSKK